MKNEANKSHIFIILRLARFFLNFERKIAAFLLVWDAETKHLIGCKRVVAAVYCYIFSYLPSLDIWSACLIVSSLLLLSCEICRLRAVAKAPFNQGTSLDFFSYEFSGSEIDVPTFMVL